MKTPFQKRTPPFYPQPWVQALLLTLFCGVLFFVNLGCWDLWNPDEPRYAQVAKEMVDGGDWILMRYNGNVYPDKPPFFFWMIGLSSYLFRGFGSFSVRFPSALFGTLTVLTTFLLGKNLYSGRTGFLSGLILATSFEFVYLSTRANIDTTLTFFITASLLCLILWYRQPKAEDLKKGEGEVKVVEKAKTMDLWIYGFYVGMAFATLTKGPVGFILPLVVSLIYLGVQKDWGGMRRMRLFPGLLLFVGIVLLWYLPAVAKGGPSYLEATLLRHTVDRFAEGWSKVRPFYYYFYHFPIDFLPWTFFLPAALVYGFSKSGNEKKREFFFLFLWFALIFIFFSFSKGKRAIYLLPLYPATSLMVGKLWDDLISKRGEHFGDGWISFPLYGLMGTTLLAGAAIPWVLSIKFPSYLRYSFPITFLLVGGSLVLVVLYRFKNYGAILFLLIGISAGGYFYTSRVIFPLVNPYKSARFLSEEVRARIQPGEALVVYGRISTGPFNYYTGIVPIEDVTRVEDLLTILRSPKRVFCLLEYGDFSRFQTMEGWPKVQLLSRRGVGGQEIVLISNR